MCSEPVWLPTALKGVEPRLTLVPVPGTAGWFLGTSPWGSLGPSAMWYMRPLGAHSAPTGLGELPCPPFCLASHLAQASGELLSPSILHSPHLAQGHVRSHTVSVVLGLPAGTGFWEVVQPTYTMEPLLAWVSAQWLRPLTLQLTDTGLCTGQAL